MAGYASGGAQQIKAASLPVILKVTIPHVSVQKTLRFEPFMTVRDAMHLIAEKANMDDRDKEHLEDKFLLYVPKGEGFYLENLTMYIQAYGVQNQDPIEFRRIPSTVNIRTPDGKQEQMKVNFEVVASELLVRLCFKFQLIAQQSELFLEEYPDEDGLDPSDSLSNQGITEAMILGVRKRRKGPRSSIMRGAGSAPKGKPSSRENRSIPIEIKSKCFGLTLQELLGDGKKEKVPEVVEKCITRLEKDALQTEGLFRIPGNTNEMDRLKGLFSSGEDPDLTEEDPHDVGGVLKYFFREMPDPAFTFDSYNQVIQIGSLVDGNEQVEKLRELIETLPPLNRNLLRRLMLFLNEVSKYSEENKMTSMNLAVVFSPNLLRCLSSDPMKIIADTPTINALISVLIKNADQVFPEIPEEPELEEVAEELVETRDYAIVNMEYSGQNSEELDLQVGDKIIVLSINDNGWWTGELRGKTGLFPAVFTTPHLVASQGPPAPAPATAPAATAAPTAEAEAPKLKQSGLAELKLSLDHKTEVDSPQSSWRETEEHPETPKTPTANNNSDLAAESPSSTGQTPRAVVVQNSEEVARLSRLLDTETKQRRALEHSVGLLVEEITYLRDILEKEMQNRVKLEEFVKKELLTVQNKFTEQQDAIRKHAEETISRQQRLKQDIVDQQLSLQQQFAMQQDDVQHLLQQQLQQQQQLSQFQQHFQNSEGGSHLSSGPAGGGKGSFVSTGDSSQYTDSGAGGTEEDYYRPPTQEQQPKRQSKPPVRAPPPPPGAGGGSGVGTTPASSNTPPSQPPPPVPHLSPPSHLPPPAPHHSHHPTTPKRHKDKSVDKDKKSSKKSKDKKSSSKQQE